MHRRCASSRRSGMVMAKGVEDTRLLPLHPAGTSLNEVGRRPIRVLDQVRWTSTAAMARRQATAPAVHDHAQHARHQAQRGRPRADFSVHRRACRTEWEETLDALLAARTRPARAASPHLLLAGGRSAPGRSRASACTPTPRRRRARRGSHTTWTDARPGVRGRGARRSSTPLFDDPAVTAVVEQDFVARLATPGWSQRARGEAAPASPCRASRTSTRAASSGSRAS